MAGEQAPTAQFCMPRLALRLWARAPSPLPTISRAAMRRRSVRAESQLRSPCVSMSKRLSDSAAKDLRLIGVFSYRTTLNARETTVDEQEQDNLLNACHKRCAERTLVVLEKNGGIFIKLGQHLVRTT